MMQHGRMGRVGQHLSDGCVLVAVSGAGGGGHPPVGQVLKHPGTRKPHSDPRMPCYSRRIESECLGQGHLSLWF